MFCPQSLDAVSKSLPEGAVGAAPSWGPLTHSVLGESDTVSPLPQGVTAQEGSLGFRALVLLQQKLPGFGVTWLKQPAEMGSGKLLVGGRAAAAASPAGPCQSPGQAQDPNPNAPPRDGVAEPVPVPMRTHPPSTKLFT